MGVVDVMRGGEEKRSSVSACSLSGTNRPSPPRSLPKETVAFVLAELNIPYSSAVVREREGEGMLEQG